MILSVSRRTDIPNYYSEWFINRIKEGCLYVKNPMNAHQISRIDLSPDVVDCIVFWTKNPINIFDKLDDLKGYQYYFQITLTGYGRDVEPGLPDKNKVLLPAFKELSERIGKKRTIWRYDPILINNKYTKEYHYRAFGKIADELKDYTERVVISFVDLYAKTQRNMTGLNIKNTGNDEMIEIAEKIAQGFLQVRVDLYNVKGKIYFGEMTFFACSGMYHWFTPEFQRMVGDRIPLPNI